MRVRWPRVARGAVVMLAAAALAGCEYTYDDGLPPLGDRSPSSAPAPTPTANRLPRQRLLPPSAAASDPPPEEWSASMLTSWAEAALPDSDGLSFSFGYGIARPDQPVLATAFVPTGTLVLEYACRGAETAHLSLTVFGSGVVDSDYSCGRVWVRSIVVPEDSIAEVRSAAVKDDSAAYAYRIVRR